MRSYNTLYLISGVPYLLHIPAGTTTALAVLRAFDYDAKVSSKIPPFDSTFIKFNLLNP